MAREDLNALLLGMTPNKRLQPAGHWHMMARG